MNIIIVKKHEHKQILILSPRGIDEILNKKIVRLYGFPSSIVSDRHRVLTLWTLLLKLY